MHNSFKYSDSNKRYYTLDYFYKKKFNSKVFKVSLNAGFTCPNRDGKVGVGGCIYCSKLGSGDFAGDVNKDLVTQFNEVKDIISKKWKNSKYIGYFQANTNTYAPLEVLKEKYEQILKLDNVIGLSIATRPDSISDDCLDYLEELSKRTYLTIELGLQTIHPKTAELINRCHSLECFNDTVSKLRARNINVVVHIINGLPYETKEMMLDTIRYLNKQDIQGIKIHMLHITKNTLLEKMYEKEKFKVLTKEEYVDIVCDQLEILNENIVINRITGDPKKEDLIEPTWVLKKFGVLNDIDKCLAKRNTYQGFNRSILNRFHSILESFIKPNDIVIDATIGNGHDTLFLSNLVPKGFVYGFDIQDKALINTKALLEKNNITNYKLFKTSHSNMLKELVNFKGKISCITFNLGYLPGNDNKEVTTKFKTTIKAVEDALELLNNKGIILVVVYPGHPEGKKEKIALEKFLKDKNKTYYYNTNNIDAPFLIEIKKR